MKYLKIGAMFMALISISKSSIAEEKAAIASPVPAPKAMPVLDKDSKKEGIRNFYEVLEDLLSDFEYDIKNNEVKGLREVAIRAIGVSENIPDSFKSHLELVLTEKIIKNSSNKVKQCLQCKSKRAKLEGDNVVILSPDANPVELSRVAQLAGIQHFMDVAFAYQSNGMMLSLMISEPETGGIVWSKSYNSETSRAAAIRRGVDYSQIEGAKDQTKYEPSVQHRATIFFLFEPGVSEMNTNLGLGYRMMERYDNRKKEVGFELSYLKDTESMVDTSTTSTAIYSTFNLTLLFVHAWNFIGEFEPYNKMRGGVYFGLGGTFATGYLSALFRGAYEWRLGKHFSFAGIVGYRPEAVRFIGTKNLGTVSGLEFGLGISVLF